MPHVFNMPLTRFCQKLFFSTALIMASLCVWGETSASPDMAVEETKDVPGYIIVAVIFNVSLVIVIFYWLKKEWNKHKVVPKTHASAKGDEK